MLSVSARGRTAMSGILPASSCCCPPPAPTMMHNAWRCDGRLPACVRSAPRAGRWSPRRWRWMGSWPVATASRRWWSPAAVGLGPRRARWPDRSTSRSRPAWRWRRPHLACLPGEPPLLRDRGVPAALPGRQPVVAGRRPLGLGLRQLRGVPGRAADPARPGLVDGLPRSSSAPAWSCWSSWR